MAFFGLGKKEYDRDTPRKPRKLGSFLASTLLTKLIINTFFLAIIVLISTNAVIWSKTVINLMDYVQVLAKETSLELDDLDNDDSFSYDNFCREIGQLYDYTVMQHPEIVDIYLMKKQAGDRYAMVLVCGEAEKKYEGVDSLVVDINDLRKDAGITMWMDDDKDDIDMETYLELSYRDNLQIVSSFLVGDDEEYVIIAECDISDTLVDAIKVTLNITILFVITIMIIMTRNNFLIKKNITMPLAALKEGVDKYEYGALHIDYDKLRWDDELYQLALSFDNITKRNEEYLAEIAKINIEKERVERELQIAGEIQSDNIPKNFESFSEDKPLDIYGMVKPMREVGGDFYDFFAIDENRVGLAIADVSGKGMDAAFFMSMTEALIKEHLMTGESPETVAQRVNERLCEDNPRELFVTVWLGVYDISTGRLEYVNAGHEYPAIYRSSEDSYKLQKEDHDFVLGMLQDRVYRKRTIDMLPGDKLFLYTDGIPEAIDKDEVQYGLERLEETLNSEKMTDPVGTVKAVADSVKAFCGEVNQSDDLTMLCIEFQDTGKKQGGNEKC
ncbi:MAG: serine/threonine-protein phosphatase [Lachnospiraceae bacterium]|nr:serine/threonine-protein phosphatase [Lachnospiraceae bacterium]